MLRACLAGLFLALEIGILQCQAQGVKDGLPVPRPLGKEFQSYHAPVNPPATGREARSPVEPTGVIALRDVLALTLMQNPDLAAFSWETRAAEARTLQAGLLPNPEVGVTVENFGNTALKGVDGTATTVQLSQLVLLGGKISKRKRVAALERDLVLTCITI
jgi:cobalt-zinc-cadmium efflux system outer membrane protein